MDYSLVHWKDLKDVLHTRAITSTDCYTDHCLVRAKVRLTIKPPVRMENYEQRSSTLMGSMD